MMTNTSHFWSETLYNKRHPWKELQEFGTYDTSQYTWQNTEGGVKKLRYYEFIFICYTTPLTWIVHQLPRREDRCTPRAALTGLPCSYTSNRTRPFCSLLPPGRCILCSLTLELEKHKNLAWFFSPGTQISPYSSYHVEATFHRETGCNPTVGFTNLLRQPTDSLECTKPQASPQELNLVWGE